MNRTLRRIAGYIACCITAAALTACAGKEAMNMKIHTDPEGSHIVYRVVKDTMEQDAQWIYLGVTPYQGITLIDSDALGDDDTVSFKVMRCGYLDQVREWTGEQFLEEYEKNDMLFWTPHLVKAGK